MTQLTKNFSVNELKCGCCGACPMQPEFMQLLQKYRDIIVRPMKITSGYRCPKHNAEVGGAKSSMHTKGQAVDIAWHHLTGQQKAQMLEEAMKIFTGIGLHRSFLHVDNRTGSQLVWFY